MLKKIIKYISLTAVVLIFVGCTGNTLSEPSSQKSNKFRIDEIALLPHPGKFVKKGIITLSNEQKNGMKNIKATIVPIFQNKMREAFALEKKLQRAVAKGKTKEELKVLLDEITQLKREAIDARIDALNGIKQLMNKDQWKKVNQLTYR